MYRFIRYAVPSFMFVVGCVGASADDVGHNAAAVITESDLKTGGFTCIDLAGGTAICTKCLPDGLCLVEYCDVDGCISCNLNPDMCGGRYSLDGDAQYWFEGEAGTLTAPMQKIVSSTASGGFAVGDPNGATGGGYATYAFTTSMPTTFYPWARALAPSTAANSFAIQIDSGPSMAFDVPVSGSSYAWSPVQRAGDTTRTSFDLPAGRHVLRIYGREAGALIDRLLLTDGMSFTPIVSTLEAELMSRHSPMTTGTTMTIPMVGYAWVPTGDHRSGANLMADAAVLHPGKYVMWGRVNAPSSSHDSFAISNDFGARTEWTTPVTSSTGWAWGEVTAAGATSPAVFSLSATSFVEVDGREDGTKLDKLIITNDPGFRPKDPSVGSTSAP